MSQPWLLAGALWAETLPLLLRLERGRPLGPRRVAGILGGRAVIVLTCGVGPDRAERRVARALREHDVAGVLSFGTCGALHEGLPVGAVRAGRTVRVLGGGPEGLHPLPGVPSVDLLTVAAPVDRAAERARLQGLAELCEMEAAAVLRAAGAVGVPAAALKVVSDRAGADPTEGLHRRDPLAVARFYRLSFGLVQARLLPVLEAALPRL